MVAFSLQASPLPPLPPPGPPEARPGPKQKVSITPREVHRASQRLDVGGFRQSARAGSLYSEIQGWCHDQRRHLGGAACEVSMERMAEAIGVRVRQTCNLLRQLRDNGFVRGEIGKGFRGVNRLELVLPAPVLAPVPARHPRNGGRAAAPMRPTQKIADDGVAVEVQKLKNNTGSGAGASRPAPSAAGETAPPSAPAGCPPGGGTTRSTPGSEGQKAKPAPKPATGKLGRPVIHLWDVQSADWQTVVTRHLNIELPGIPADLLAYALDQVRAAKCDQAAGGAPVRNPYRYAVAVAKKKWGGFTENKTKQNAAGGAGARAAAATTRCLTMTIQNDGNSPVVDPCGHGFGVHENCSICDHTAPACFRRAASRHAPPPPVDRAKAATDTARQKDRD